MPEKILGVKVDTVTFDKALTAASTFVAEPRFHLITTVNAEFILTAQTDLVFKEILNGADLSLPDGVGVLMAQRYLSAAALVPAGLLRPLQLFWLGLKVGFLTKLPERVAGSDLFKELVKQAAANNWRVGLLGGESFKGEEVCNLTKQALLATWPLLQIAYCSREPTPEIFATPLDLLFVAFGHPKQEKWLGENKDRLSRVRVGMGVGGTFDFIIGKQHRAPRLLQQLKLEWLWRLILQPTRFKRIFSAYPIFPLQVFLSSLRT